MIEKLDFIADTTICTDEDGYFRNVLVGQSGVRKINELVDAVNELQKDYDNVCVWVGEQELKTPDKNVQDRMIGCTTLNIPERYKNDQLTLATLDYNKKLEKENSDLKDKLERITDILYESKYALEEVINPSFISHEQEIAQEALDKVNAEIKAITGEQ